jgi:hypothetical protein
VSPAERDAPLRAVIDAHPGLLAWLACRDVPYYDEGEWPVLLYHLTGVKVRGCLPPAPPVTATDLQACSEMLGAVPSLRPLMDGLAGADVPGWSDIAARWCEVESMVKVGDTRGLWAVLP